MRKSMFLLAGIALLALGCASTEKSARQDAEVENQVRRLLAEMTVEEKVGQMTQITLDPFAKSGKDGHL
ncbi:MAG: hypothetical protein JSW27_10070, partial [Phycisphaerales bacterium]